jgi:hypothetical protein
MKLNDSHGSQFSPNAMSGSPERAGSSRGNPIIIEEDDDVQQNPEEDNSDAETVRMSTPNYEEWANDNCSTTPHNVPLTESTPPSTFLSYEGYGQSECTPISQASPLTEGESKKEEDIKKGKWIIAWSCLRRILTKTMLFQLSRTFGQRIGSRRLVCRPCSI